MCTWCDTPDVVKELFDLGETVTCSPPCIMALNDLRIRFTGVEIFNGHTADPDPDEKAAS